MQQADPAFYLDFLHNLGILALVTLCFGSVLRRTTRGLGQQIAIGVLFAPGIFLAMIDPIHVRNGVTVDTRAIFIGLAGVFGGWPATLMTTASGIATRLTVGGAGATVGSLAMLLPAAAGLLYGRIMHDNPAQFGILSLIGLGIASSTMMAGMLFLPERIVWPVFMEAGVPTIICTIVGTVFFGRLLARERVRHDHALRLREEAQVDELTGLLNRRSFDRLAEASFQETRERGQAFALVIFDVDHFKRINDVWGHASGDRVLKHLSKVIAAGTRTQDIVCRFGGEEIAVLMPRTTEDEAAVIAERIRHVVTTGQLDMDGTRLDITLSAGVAAADRRIATFEALFRTADKALYGAKFDGRNRVKAASQSLHAA